MELKQVLHCGHEFPPAPCIPLRAGPLALDFDPKSASVRNIRFGNREVVRGIYAAVRDRNWGTVTPEVTLITQAVGDRGFRLHFEVACRQGDIDFRWTGRLSGGEDGTIQFLFQGEAKSTFLRNRIGFCVLHPIAGCAGKPCWIECVDGARVKGEFPFHIAPDQPFKNIRAVLHDILPGCKAEVRMEGDTFEMEDQRNWTDASYKTYCTPLDLPFPVEVTEGTYIQQMVTVRVQPSLLSHAVELGRDVVEIQIDPDKKFAIPAIGLGMPSHGQSASPRERDLLKRLKLDHLRVDAHPGAGEWKDRFSQACLEAAGIGAGLEAAVSLSHNFEAELRELLVETVRCSAPIRLWTLYGPSDLLANSFDRIRLILDGAGGKIPIAVGSNANYAEWNRSRPGQRLDAMPCFAMTPQIHAFDRISMLETLQAQAMTVDSAWHWTRNSVVVSPVTLRPRFNAVATDASANKTDSGIFPPQADIRQLSLFCAGWTLGSLAALFATGHCHSVTYYETSGWRGIMETEKGSPLPEAFPSIPGSVFPIYHVFASLAGYSHMAPLIIGGSQDLAGLALFDGVKLSRILVANLGPDPLEPAIELESESLQIALLDSTTAIQAMTNPEDWSPQTTVKVAESRLVLNLPPFALARIDL
jgi:hypothetical protein